MDPAEQYEILRALTSPIVAITTRLDEKLNGMIANSAIRASLTPGRQSVANYVFKRHLTHDFLARTGRYVLHVLSREQWEEIFALGFRSGREVDKLDGLSYRLSESSGLPILTRCWAWMECRVLNVMDAGSSTFFMGRIVDIGRGTGEEVMDSDHFRSSMPVEWRPMYEEKLIEAQKLTASLSEEVDDAPWRALRARVGKGAGE